MNGTENKPEWHLTRPGSVAQQRIREFCRRSGRKVGPTTDRALLLGLDLLEQWERKTEESVAP